MILPIDEAKISFLFIHFAFRLFFSARGITVQLLDFLPTLHLVFDFLLQHAVILFVDPFEFLLTHSPKYLFS